jgi:hypothetical protein
LKRRRRRDSGKVRRDKWEKTDRERERERERSLLTIKM